ncbi:hypothetical protein BJ944DRAFT_176507, partial [Cunninghamella echinulata]
MEPTRKNISNKGIKHEQNLPANNNNNQHENYYYTTKRFQQSNPSQYHNHTTNTMLYQPSHINSLVTTTVASTMSNLSYSNANLLDLSYIPLQTQWNIQLRDNLLQYAHTIYSTTPQNPLLFTILHSIHNAYPTHLPTLLLLACVYYSQQDYNASLRYNQLILKYDPIYVEAMSNIGTTLKVLGKITEAEDWWYKAIKIRPNYWDAIENLVGNLCSSTALSIIKNGSAASTTTTTTANRQQSNLLIRRYNEAIDLCNFVENYFFKSDVISPPKHFPLLQLPRLQNIFYMKGNLKLALGDSDGAQVEYEKALELAFGGANLLSIIQHMALICGSSVAIQASQSKLTLDSHSLPLILLQPVQAVQILQFMYPHTNGLLPSVVLTNLNLPSPPSSSSPSSPSSKNSNIVLDTAVTETVLKKLLQSTSSVLLSLAKLIQDKMNSTLST